MKFPDWIPEWVKAEYAEWIADPASADEDSSLRIVERVIASGVTKPVWRTLNLYPQRKERLLDLGFALKEASWEAVGGEKTKEEKYRIAADVAKSLRAYLKALEELSPGDRRALEQTVGSRLYGLVNEEVNSGREYLRFNLDTDEVSVRFSEDEIEKARPICLAMASSVASDFMLSEPDAAMGAVIAGFDEWAKSVPVTHRPHRRNADLLFFVRKMSAFWVDEYGGPRLGATAALANALFDNCSLSESDVAKMRAAVKPTR